MKTPTKRPGSPLDSIYRRVDLSPEQIFQALSRLRREAEQQVEYLIELMNTIDGDADAEASADDEEPSLGSVSTYCSGGSQTGWSQGNRDDREAECQDEGAQCDDEGYEDNGIADLDGLMEQCPAMFEGHDQRVIA